MASKKYMNIEVFPVTRTLMGPVYVPIDGESNGVSGYIFASEDGAVWVLLKKLPNGNWRFLGEISTDTINGHRRNGVRVVNFRTAREYAKKYPWYWRDFRTRNDCRVNVRIPIKELP